MKLNIESDRERERNVKAAENFGQRRERKKNKSNEIMEKDEK